MATTLKNKIVIAFQKWKASLLHTRQNRLIRNFEDLIVDNCSSQDESCKSSDCARFNKPDVPEQVVNNKVFPIFDVRESNASQDAQAIEETIKHLQEIMKTASQSDLLFLKDNILRMNSNAKRMRDMVHNIQMARG